MTKNNEETRDLQRGAEELWRRLFDSAKTLLTGKDKNELADLKRQKHAFNSEACSKIGER